MFLSNNTSPVHQTTDNGRILLVTDVFGITPAVATLARQLPLPVDVIAAYDELHFQSEQVAYTHFVANGGVAAYRDKISQHLAQAATKGAYRMAIGFSAGASALWATSEAAAWADCQQMVLFYGSRIRELREVQPACPSRLIFAEKEAAFDPKELVADLRRRGHGAELVRESSHGFMNSYSAGYHPKLYTLYIDQLQQFLFDFENQQKTPRAIAA